MKPSNNRSESKGSLDIRTSLNPKTITLVVIAVFTLFIGGLHVAAETRESYVPLEDDPLSGTWVLDLSKSKIPSQLSILKGQIAHVVVNASDFEITQETIYGADERFNIQVKAKFDGNDYPITGVPIAYSAAYQRLDKNTIKAVLKLDGKVVVQETGVISPDGKSLTVIFYITDATGKQETVIAVFEKK